MNTSMSSVIGPLTSVGAVTIAAPGQGKRNCLTSLIVESSGAADVTIASGGVNIALFAIVAATPFALEWPVEFPFMGSDNANLVITVSAGNYNISYQGFVNP